MQHWPTRIVFGGSFAARVFNKSARCMPYMPFQPVESVVTIGPTTVPSARQYRDPSPIFAPTAAKASPSPSRSSCRRPLGRSDQASPNLAERSGLLENRDFDASLAQRAGGGNTANSAADDGGAEAPLRSRFIAHAKNLWNLRADSAQFVQSSCACGWLTDSPLHHPQLGVSAKSARPLHSASLWGALIHALRRWAGRRQAGAGTGIVTINNDA